MTGQLKSLIEEKGVLLADGATGTNFFDMGMQAGDAPEMWNLEEPDKVRALHRSFVEAGSDIILTNSFGGTRHRLKLHNAQGRVHELNKAAAKLARDEADKADRKVLVGGSVGPTGELFVPLGELTMEDAIDSFTEQMKGLIDGGVDVLWIETMSATEEIEAAAQAARNVNMDYIFTASFDTAGRTMMGIPPEHMGTIGAKMSPAPVAVGANCGVGATDLLYSVLSMTKEGPCAQGGQIAVIAKANCGMPRIKGDQVIYTGTPELMAKYVHLAIDSGAKIIGGCCGTSPVHLAAMRKAIDDHKAGTRPSHEEIVEGTGKLANPISKKIDDDGEVKTGRRGGRRR